MPSTDFDLILPERLKSDLFNHLFVDGDEHGAVLSAGVVRTSRGLRLLARELFVARDGTDYVPGQRGYRMLTPRFVADRARHCRDDGLAYLAVHNHGVFGYETRNLREVPIKVAPAGHP